jgi:hypothetical protein
MRTNLSSFFRKLSLCATVAIAGVWGQQSLRAHDLPNFIPYHELGADCLGIRTPAETRPAKVSVPAKPRPVLQLSNGLAPAQELFSRLDPQRTLAQVTHGLQIIAKGVCSGASRCFETLDAPPRTSLLTAMPEDAPPPAPSPKPASPAPASQLASAPRTATQLAGSVPSADAPAVVAYPLVPRNYVEDYLPYDLCVRDWRFGRFTYRGLSRIAHLPAPVAEVSDAGRLARAFPEEVIAPFAPNANAANAANAAHAAAFARGLRELESFECRLYGELHRMDSVAFLGGQLAQSWSASTKTAALWLAKIVTPDQPPQPLFTAPQFVIYEASGKSFVLPVEQAKEWQRLRQQTHELQATPGAVQATVEGLAQSTTTATATEIASHTAAATNEPLDASLLKLASRQLANLGQHCLQLSNMLDSYTSQRMAATSGAEQVR